MKTKYKTVYKVCFKSGDGRLHSAFIWSTRNGVEYHVKKWNKANDCAESKWLFCFKSLKLAREYYSTKNMYSIFKCRVKSYRTTAPKELKPFSGASVFPESTVWSKEVYLIKEV